MIFLDLPNDIIEEIYIGLYKNRNLATIKSLALTSKVLNDIFIEVNGNQCKKEAELYRELYANKDGKTLIRLAFEHGLLYLVIDLFKNIQTPIVLSDKTMAHAASNLEIVKWLHENKKGGAFTYGAMCHAAANNCLDVVKYLYENKLVTPSSIVMDTAVNFGHLEIVKWLHEKIGSDTSGISVTSDTSVPVIDIAIQNGHLDIAKWLYGRGYKIQTSMVFQAAKQGRLDIIKWLEEIGEIRKYDFTWDAIDEAAGNGHLNTVKWLYEKYTSIYVDTTPCTTWANDSAAENGHLDIVKFLYDWGYTCTEQGMSGAAKNGHFDCVKFLHYKWDSYYGRNRLPCTKNIIDGAAENGHLNIIKWLSQTYSEYGVCLCTESAMDRAAKNGYLNVVKWLNENYWGLHSPSIMDFAAENGHLDVLEYLHKNTIGKCSVNAIELATKNGYLNVLKFFYDNFHNAKFYMGADTLRTAARFGYIDIIKWLDEKGYTPTIEALNISFENNHINMDSVKWLYNRIKKYPNNNSMYNAASKGHLKVLKWYNELVPYGFDKKLATDLIFFAISAEQLVVVEWLESLKNEN